MTPTVNFNRVQLPVTDCNGCGVCCMHMGAPPYDEEEIELLRANLPDVYADYMAVSVTRELQLRATGVDSVPCGFFDLLTRKCRHHEFSPDICARFEVGGEFCLQQREDAGL